MGIVDKIALGAALLFGLGGTVMLTYAPKQFPSFEPYGFWVGVALFLLSASLLIWVFLHRREAHEMANDFSIKTGDVSGSNNRIGHEFHKPRQRTMSEEVKTGLLRELSKDRPVSVFGMNGNTESMIYANEIHAFLAANGYQMTSDTANWHMFFNPPVHTAKISPGNGGKEWWITVGPAE